MIQRPVIGKFRQFFLFQAPAENSLRPDPVLMAPQHKEVVRTRGPAVTPQAAGIGGCQAAPDQRGNDRVAASDNVVVGVLAANARQSPFANHVEPGNRALDIGIQSQEFA